MLDTGNVTPRTYIFSRQGSFKAAKLAYKLERDEQKRLGKGESRIKALGKAWTAFKFRRVTIPEADGKPLNNISKDIRELVSKYTNTRICTRKLTPFETLEDFKWSEGNAKKLTRHVVVRHWSSPHIKDSSIHTALSMKDEKSNDYSAWGPDYSPKEDDWRMSENKYKQRVGNLLTPARKYIGKLIPEMPESYSMEKGHYMSPKARMKLIKTDENEAKAEQLAKLIKDSKQPLAAARKKAAAELRKIGLGAVFSPSSWKKIAVEGVSEFRALRKAREKLPSENPTDNPDKKGARPFNFQKRNKKLVAFNDALPDEIPIDDYRRKNPWERRAQKVYLPCSGFSETREEGKRHFMMFGLNLEAMRKTWAEVKDPASPRHYYKTVSKFQNCSGMSLSLLKDGGADHYAILNPRLYTNQAMVDRYSHKLMERMDSLNEKTDFLFDQYKKIQPGSIVNSKDAPVAIRKSSKETENKKFKRSLNALARLTDEFSKTKIPLEALTPFAIKFVDALEYACSVSGGGDKEMKALEPALCVFANIRSQMMRTSTQSAPSEGGG